MQMLHGRLPSHLSFLRLQLSQAWAMRRLFSGATIGRGIASVAREADDLGRYSPTPKKQTKGLMR